MRFEKKNTIERKFRKKKRCRRRKLLCPSGRIHTPIAVFNLDSIKSTSLGTSFFRFLLISMCWGCFVLCLFVPLNVGLNIGPHQRPPATFFVWVKAVLEVKRNPHTCRYQRSHFYFFSLTHPSLLPVHFFSLCLFSFPLSFFQFLCNVSFCTSK